MAKFENYNISNFYPFLECVKFCLKKFYHTLTSRPSRRRPKNRQHKLENYRNKYAYLAGNRVNALLKLDIPVRTGGLSRETSHNSGCLSLNCAHTPEISE